MPTTYTDQFFDIDPYSPPPVGTAMNWSHYNLIDQNDDGDFDQNDNDSVNGFDVTGSYAGDTITINVAGVGNVTYTGVTFYLAGGGRVFTPSDGQVLQNGTLVSTTWVSPQGPLLASDLGPSCFTTGTRIKTDKGNRKIQDLNIGDLVETHDNGLMPIRWISRGKWEAKGVNAPVLIRKGALGNTEDLYVSQQHRMLITGWQAQLFLGTDEALVAAKHLANDTTISIVESCEVEYFHLLFDQHEIITAAGIPSESYHPAHASELNDQETIAEITRLFPELAENPANSWKSARPIARSFEAYLLAA